MICFTPEDVCETPGSVLNNFSFFILSRDGFLLNKVEGFYVV
jgi:hypothetical protein